MSLLYFRISRTMSKNALSTLMRDLAEVSMNVQPKERARSRPSVVRISYVRQAFEAIRLPSVLTCRSCSRSHLLPTTIMGK